MDRLKVEAGLVYLTDEQERVTGLPNPSSLDLLKDDPFLLQHNLWERQADLAARYVAADTKPEQPEQAETLEQAEEPEQTEQSEEVERPEEVEQPSHEGSGELLLGEKLIDALHIVEDRERVIRDMAEQLAPYLLDLRVTEEHDD